MHFAHPKILFLFLTFIPAIIWYVLKQRKSYPTIAISTTAPFRRGNFSVRAALRHSIFILNMAALACMIIVLARPQSRESWHTSSVEGTDIVLALDVSSSMMTTDFTPNRLEAAKEVAQKFVNGRENDNMGVVIFAGESLTGVPMTTDRATLVNYISSLKINMIDDGTAIGDGIATAVNRIKGGKAKSKSIILLTDGTNNAGILTPLTAAEIAATLGIKIYVIGVGTEGYAKVLVGYDFGGRPIYEPQKVQIDEATLRQIAQTTGGKYFRATDNNVLSDVFDEINTLETTKLDVRNFSHTEDNYFYWAFFALCFAACAAFLRQTLFRTIP